MPKDLSTHSASQLNRLTSRLGRVTVKSVMSAPVWIMAASLAAMIIAGAIPSIDPITRYILDTIGAGSFVFAVVAYFVFGNKNPRYLMTEETQIEMMRMDIEQQGHSAPVLPAKLIDNPALEQNPPPPAQSQLGASDSEALNNPEVAR